MATVATQLNSAAGFSSGEIVTAAKLNTLVNSATVSGIVDADISPSALIAASKLATTLDLSAKTLVLPSSSVDRSQLVAAVQQSLVPAGAVQAFARSTAPSGWLAANGNTIGSASSGATNASADYSALFAVLWDNWTNTNLPILNSAGTASTRGVSAAADFSANKRLPLPNLQGIFIRGSGSQTISGTNFSGTFAERQSHQIADHRHDMPEGYNIGGSSNGAYAKAATGGGTALPTDQVSSTFTPTTPVGDETRPANISLLYCIKF
jgi:hypothetical protein